MTISFFIFQLSLHGEGRGPIFEQTWFPITAEFFVPSLVEIGSVVLERNMKMLKVFRQTDVLTDGQTHGQTGVQQAIRIVHFSFSSGDLKYKNGVPLLLNPAPVYIFFKFCIFWRKLHNIFCIVCTYMLHNLHRTYIPH